MSYLLPLRTYLPLRLARVEAEIERLLKELEELERERAIVLDYIKQWDHTLTSGDPVAYVRSLTPSEVDRMSASELETLFEAIAGYGRAMACPACGHAQTYRHKSRAIFSCRSCHKQFSRTSKTAFAGRKLDLRTILMIASIINTEPGIPKLQISKRLKIEYKTACLTIDKLKAAGLIGDRTKVSSRQDDHRSGGQNASRAISLRH